MGGVVTCLPRRPERSKRRDSSRPSSTVGPRSRACGPRRRWLAGPGGAGPAAEPTSAEAPEPELPAAASSCTAVVGIAVPVVALLAEPRLLEEVASLLAGREVQRGFVFERALLRFGLYLTLDRKGVKDTERVCVKGLGLKKE